MTNSKKYIVKCLATILLLLSGMAWGMSPVSADLPSPDDGPVIIEDMPGDDDQPDSDERPEGEEDEKGFWEAIWAWIKAFFTGPEETPPPDDGGPSGDGGPTGDEGPTNDGGDTGGGESPPDVTDPPVDGPAGGGDDTVNPDCEQLYEMLMQANAEYEAATTELERNLASGKLWLVALWMDSAGC